MKTTIILGLILGASVQACGGAPYTTEQGQQPSTSAASPSASPQQSLTCAGPANGGTPGFQDPPASWTYDMGCNGGKCQACASVLGTPATCIECDPDLAQDAVQCLVTTDVGYVIGMDPVHLQYVYITAPNGAVTSWTPRCSQ